MLNFRQFYFFWLQTASMFAWGCQFIQGTLPKDFFSLDLHQVNPLSPSKDKHLISPYNIYYLIEHTGHENEENGHQL